MMASEADGFELPLADLRVLELGTLIAVPFAGRLLADFGADVIKIEHPTSGDPLRSWGMGTEDGPSLWSLLQSRGKRSVALDLHDPDAQDVVRRLADTCDVLIENFRPGRLEGWNLDPSALQQRNPKLVVVRVSGYGQTGPLAEQPGFGTVAEAVGGLRYLTGQPDQPPTRAGLSLGDSIASLHALIGAFVALHERRRSHRGQVVDVALTEAVVSMLEGVIPEYGYYGAVRERTGNLAHNSAPTNAYPCRDGSEVCIGANSTGLFRALCSVMDRSDLRDEPRFSTNEGRVADVASIDAAITEWTSMLTADEVVTKLQAAGIPVGKIHSVAEIVADEQLQERDMLLEIHDKRLGKPLLVPGVTPRLSRTPGAVRELGPELGYHNEEVLKEVNWDTDA